MTVPTLASKGSSSAVVRPQGVSRAARVLTPFGPAALTLAGGFAILWALSGNDYYSHIAVLWLLSTLLALSLNWIFGFSGYLPLAHAAFYALGAYTSALLVIKLGVPFWLAVLAGTLATGLFALAISRPALRTSGIFFGIVTFGVSEIVRVVIANWDSVTHGTQGLTVTYQPPALDLFGRVIDFGTPTAYGMLLVPFVALYVYVTALIARSSLGRRLIAIREDEELSASIGIHNRRCITIVFVLSACGAGFAGCLFAPYFAFLHPSYFNMWTTVGAILAVIVGGAMTTAGPILGALVVIVLPEVLGFAESARSLLYGALTVLVIMLAPNGLLGVPAQWRRRKAEPVAVRQSEAGSPSPLAFQASGDQPSKPELPVSLPPDEMTPQAVTRGAGVTVSNVSVRFGGIRALEDVSFEVMPGEILGIFGPNGAGKSTLFNAICGYRRPTSGRIFLDGQDITGLGTATLAGKGLVRTFQIPRIFAALTVREHLEIARESVGRSADGPGDQKILEQLGLGKVANVSASGLTHGDRKRLGIAAALVARPSVLLLDEPAAGLNGAERARMLGLLRQVNQLGVSLLLVEHDVAFVLAVAKRVIVLDSGRLIYSGPASGVRADERVRKAYIGE